MTRRAKKKIVTFQSIKKENFISWSKDFLFVIENIFLECAVFIMRKTTIFFGIAKFMSSEVLTSLDITSLKLALRRWMYFVSLWLWNEFRRCEEPGPWRWEETYLVGRGVHFVWIEISASAHQPLCRCFCERKVGAIKLDISLKQLGPRNLSREEFTNFIQEVASIVNHTPLGEVSADPNDPVPISPMSLLTLRENQSLVQRFDEVDILAYGKCWWRRVQYLVDQFWLAWKRDYFKSLYVRRKWKKRTRNVCTGDVFLLWEQTSRNSWPMGMVTDVRANRDSVVSP